MSGREGKRGQKPPRRLLDGIQRRGQEKRSIDRGSAQHAAGSVAATPEHSGEGNTTAAAHVMQQAQGDALVLSKAQRASSVPVHLPNITNIVRVGKSSCAI
ncbi:hypothetical protein F2P81_001518 [Scophthalmus maximus]|uniref:Uncharacterized protein n=1 Tax=Scophthalmus maximus TaxID=52904 RepID=A0A6A4TJK3_SCOMX|nr:hypothetical protein F2P81_001518 [Scophthalmus maximus]